MTALPSAQPRYILMHEADNVAIVVNDGGLPAGAVFASGLSLRDKVPQGHKVALVDLPQGGIVRRYNVPIGYAARDIPAGSWVHERLLEMPAARGLDNLPIATVKPAPMPPPTRRWARRCIRRRCSTSSPRPRWISTMRWQPTTWPRNTAS